jgi:hypothetical protein
LGEIIKMRELTLTEFSNKFSKTGKIVKFQWPHFVQELFQKGHVLLKDKNMGAAIVAGASKNGRHQKISFSSIDMMIFDCDNVSLTKIENWLSENISNAAWFIYSTYSHQWYNGRFRVIIPAKKSIPKDEYHIIWSSIDIPGKDEATKDISRLCYLPATKNGNSNIMRWSAVFDRFHDFLEISSGERNSKIAQLIGYWCNGKKIKKETLLKRAQKINIERCNPPLDESEINTIVDSIYSTEMNAREEGKAVYNEKKESKSKIAVDIALSNIELYRGDGYEAVVKLNNLYYLVESSIFEWWLTKKYYDEINDIIGRSGYIDAIHTIRSIALSKEDVVNIFRRVGYNEEENKLVYHLGDIRYVHIDQNGWQLVEGDSCNLCFVHENNFKNCPNPINDPKIDLWSVLRPFFNVNDADFMLILAWIIGSFWPYGPFPVLLGIGEHGTAKSTASELCAKIVDNRMPVLIKPPKDSDNLYVSANSRHVLSLDNLSYINDELSDDLCRLATGSGYEKRKLYTDSGTVSFSGSRPQILNSILSTIIGRGDLLDRSIIVNYLPIQKYVSSDVIENAFNSALPYIYGAIFNALSNILHNLHCVTDDVTISRMASFEKRIKATNMPWVDHFTQIFSTNRVQTEINYVAGDEVYEAIVQFFTNSGESFWTGLISDFVKLLDLRFDSKYRSTKTFGKHIERIKPHLRKIGINVEKSRIAKGMTYAITYRELEK